MDRKNSDWVSIMKGASIGVGGSMIAAIVMTALAASMVSGERIGETSLDYVTVVILIISSIGGAMAASAVVGHHRLHVCLITGAGYLALLLASAILLFDGVDGTVGVTALTVMGSAGAAALIGMGGRQKGKRPRYSKIRNR